MTDIQLENYFGSIKSDFNRMDDRFTSVDKVILEIKDELAQIKQLCSAILDIVNMYDVERKEIKASLWDLDNRLHKLEVVKN